MAGTDRLAANMAVLDASSPAPSAVDLITEMTRQTVISISATNGEHPKSSYPLLVKVEGDPIIRPDGETKLVCTGVYISDDGHIVLTARSV